MIKQNKSVLDFPDELDNKGNKVHKALTSQWKSHCRRNCTAYNKAEQMVANKCLANSGYRSFTLACVECWLNWCAQWSRLHHWRAESHWNTAHPFTSHFTFLRVMTWGAALSPVMIFSAEASTNVSNTAWNSAGQSCCRVCFIRAWSASKKVQVCTLHVFAWGRTWLWLLLAHHSSQPMQ